MPSRSAGLLLYRDGPGHHDDELEVLLGHPGGPFWARKDDGAWSIPKGEYHDGEDPWAAAQREFTEEIGTPPPTGPRIDLPPVRQSGGKIVTAFAVKGDLDVRGAVSNTFTMEWPPRSGRMAEFPELDRIAWWGMAAAYQKLLKSQRPLLDALTEALG
ncbi:MAG: NUDIX domain-containing protein [Mycobacterium kyogaense]|uniref:NUDIX domain-containing protein n=1 Tax=Mycobacterium kyogaense TaxID=2212479 RepID=UPI002FFAE5BF